jgi:hypothetical protein
MGKRHSPEQIVRKLRQAEARLAAGATVPQAARELGISGCHAADGMGEALGYGEAGQEVQ